jgi:hypothetical protein
MSTENDSVGNGTCKTAIYMAVYIHIYTMQCKCAIGGVALQKYIVGHCDIKNYGGRLVLMSYTSITSNWPHTYSLSPGENPIAVNNNNNNNYYYYYYYYIRNKGRTCKRPSKIRLCLEYINWGDLMYIMGTRLLLW